MELQPMIMAAIIAVVGLTEGLKKKLPKMSSTLISIVAAIFTSAAMADIPSFDGPTILKAVQQTLFNTALIIGGAWLMYDQVINRFRPKAEEERKP